MVPCCVGLECLLVWSFNACLRLVCRVVLSSAGVPWASVVIGRSWREIPCRFCWSFGSCLSLLAMLAAPTERRQAPLTQSSSALATQTQGLVEKLGHSLDRPFPPWAPTLLRWVSSRWWPRPPGTTPGGHSGQEGGLLRLAVCSCNSVQFD